MSAAEGELADAPRVDVAGQAVDRWSREHHAELVEVRRHLHAHPELGFAEHGTTAHLEQRLTAA